MNELMFFTYPSCTSCRKTKKWLKQYDIVFKERHLFRDTPTFEEMLKILSLTTEGLDELLATRSQSFKMLDKDINELSLSQVLTMIIEEPKLLRRPILTDGKKLIVGFNPDALKKMTNNKYSNAV